MLHNARRAYIAAAAVVLTSFSVSGHAVIIDTSTNNPYAFSWSFDTGTSLLTGSGTMTVSGFNTNSLLIDVSLTNTSLLASERLTSFGFGIDPNAVAVNFIDAADGGMINASLASIPSLATVEICAFGGPNCSGGGNGGILGGGGSDSFRLSLYGEWGSSVNINPIGFKYQTDIDSYQFTTTNGCCTQVPEPASSGALLGLGIGLLAIAGVARRRQQRVAR